MTDPDKSLSTRLVHEGRSSKSFGGAVNPPIKRASTLLADNVSDLYGARSLYGRMGTETHEVLREGLKTLENASHVQLAPSGLSGCALALASVVNAGDHLLMTDSAYGPTRRFAERYLARMGVSVTFFDPRINATDFKSLIRAESAVVFFEMPGSLTFELHDLNSLLPVCKEEKLVTLLDNTWAAGIFFKPLDVGIDISVQALTKYVIGHSDGFGGAAMTNRKDLALKLEQCANDWGIAMSPDDAYLAQRGLKTLSVRIIEQGKSAKEIADWLSGQDHVLDVYHPALESHPDHQVFTAHFSGSSGLFSFTVDTTNDEKLAHFFKAFHLFGFGFSWGGFESLIIPCNPQLKRSESNRWKSKDFGTLIRLQVGLEDTADLISELSDALDRLS